MRAPAPHTKPKCASRERRDQSRRSEQRLPTFTPYFIGDVVAKWLRHDGPDRLMQLRENFTFVESSERAWTAPAGFIFDGATIPRPLWSVFGDPFIGDYRRAAVIHDLLCTPFCPHCLALMIDRGRRAIPRYVCPMHPGVRPHYRVSSNDAAHTMYLAMLADGLGEYQAAAIRRAVESCGPQFSADPLSDM